MIKTISTIGLFLWISFFAPIAGQQYQGVFLIVVCILSSALFISDNSARGGAFSRKDIPLWLFLLVILIGLIGVKNPPVAYSHLWLYVFPIPFLYFFTKSVFDLSRAALILRCVCIMAASVAIYGLMEIFSGKNLIYAGLGNNPYYWLYAGSRMMSFHIHPVALGTYLAAIFPLTFVLYKIEKRRIFKSISVFCATVILAGALFTFSRGVLLALLAEMLIIVFFLTKKKNIFYLYIVLLPLSLILINSLLRHFNYLACYRYSFTDLTNWYNYSRKLTLFLGAKEMLFDHPFFGVGLGHYRVVFDSYFPLIADITSHEKKVADCMYATILAETGIVGFAAFAFFIYSILKNTLNTLRVKLKNIDLPDLNSFLLLGFFAGFAGMMCAFLTYDTLYWTAPAYLFWSFAGILAHLDQEQKRRC
ncbi:MAG: hypothetical protein KKH08_03260 [Candidatus Omnitrophica bacterium]|nr:hypothetical protein [Candidatus Omnitrophota bacterium]